MSVRRHLRKRNHKIRVEKETFRWSRVRDMPSRPQNIYYAWMKYQPFTSYHDEIRIAHAHFYKQGSTRLEWPTSKFPVFPIQMMIKGVLIIFGMDTII